jgi:uracil-DNA glycosylase
MTTSPSKKSSLDEIAKKIAATKGGPFGPGLNPVPGEGNPDAKILFVGEGPGYHEDQQGRPFVGVSGQLLRKTMRENGFNEKDVFITNIVKFRPPENRDPTPQEIEFFRPFLDEQIKIINPEIIVTLGRFSMYKFLGEGASISKIHGQARKIGEYLIFPMFHPAAALRNPPTMKSFIDDFKKLNELVNKKAMPIVAPSKNEQKQLELI